MKIFYMFHSNKFKDHSAFCTSHPSLQRLHFDTYHVKDKFPIIIGDWNLLELKTLVYSCQSP